MNKHDDMVYAQSAAIPFRLKNRSPRVLLITSRRSQRWIVPKGIVEDWQTPAEAALAEAFEEAGVRGAILGGSVGSYEYEKCGGTCRVEVFLMRVEEELRGWPESDFRERKWVGVDKAIELVDHVDLRAIMQLAFGQMK